MRPHLLSWQWQGYELYHRDRANLFLHIATAPLFILGVVAVLASPALGWAALAGGVGGMAVALVAQGRGHRREAKPAEPFLGPGDFVARFFAEQLINFPRFVLSGKWNRARRAAIDSPAGRT
ncbi:MAG TPA: hypothetical protein VKE22_21585 [Haliangiales bacterium]|nr:hypothetical protein [Haliangiales bacterium]